MADSRELEAIYNLYVDDLFTYATYLGFDNEVIMDAIHDVFCKLFSDKKILDSVKNIKFYLFKSLKNRLLDINKLEQKHIDYIKSLSSSEMPFDIQVSIEDDMIDKEEQRQIKELIDSILNILSPRQREIIYLRYVQGYDYQQIGDILGISIHCCRKHSSKALLNIRKHYGETVLLLFLLI